jgi:hypothetical protein
MISATIRNPSHPLSTTHNRYFGPLFASFDKLFDYPLLVSEAHDQKCRMSQRRFTGEIRDPCASAELANTVKKCSLYFSTGQ